MTDTNAFTAAQVAYMLREPLKAIKKALDEGPVHAKFVAKPGGSVRVVDWGDLVYLYSIQSLRDELTPKARNEFYWALKHQPIERTEEVSFGKLIVTLVDVKAELGQRVQELAKLGEKVEFRKDGEAVLKGTDIEVHRIAALLKGDLTAQEICEDYPSLTPEKIATARDYAEAHPKQGRPYPSTTVKRALRGAGLEALDDVLDEKA